MGDWSALPKDILHMISLRIDNHFDLIHFRSVCQSWREYSLATFQQVPSLRCPLPLDAGGRGGNCHILRSRIYLIKSLSPDPPRFWLFKLQEEENGELSLRCFFHYKNCCPSPCPSLSLDLLNSQITELSQEHVACYTTSARIVGMTKQRIGFMWLDAENNQFMIFGRLSFEGFGMYRSFEERWTEIETPPFPFLQAITFKGHFYSIDPTGVTTVVKKSVEMNTFTRSRPCDKTRKRWLVKSEDKLLLVEMCSNEPETIMETGWFEISKLNEERNDWIQVEDLGGHVLFLDNHCSLSFLPNQISGFRPNSIIFEDMFGRCGGYQVFEFGERGFRSFAHIPEYVQLFPSLSVMIHPR